MSFSQHTMAKRPGQWTPLNFLEWHIRALKVTVMPSYRSVLSIRSTYHTPYSSSGTSRWPLERSNGDMSGVIYSSLVPSAFSR